jgi:hypothetical protein
MVFNIGALPANAVAQNVLMSISSDPNAAVVVNERTASGSGTIRIDDLTCAQSYYFWTQAVGPGGSSSIIAAAANPYTAPSKTSRPAAPTSVTTISPALGDAPAPRYYTGGLAYLLMPATWITWAKPTDPDIASVEVRIGLSGVAADNDAIVIVGTYPVNTPRVAGYTGNIAFTDRAYVRFIDRFGNKSGWYDGGICAWYGIYAGIVGAQNAYNQISSGIQVSQGGGRQTKVIYPFNGVWACVNTGGEVTVNIPISGFSYKADGGDPVVSNALAVIRYDWDDSGNSSSNAVVKLSWPGGGTISAGTNFRITGSFWGY